MIQKYQIYQFFHSLIIPKKNLNHLQLRSIQTPIPYLFFTIPPQLIPYTQNLYTQNLSNSPFIQDLSNSSKKQIPSLDEFFNKLNESSDGIGELAKFKSVFEDERITVDQIYDLTDAEFDQLGVNKIGWRKAFKAAAKYYK